MVDGADTLAEKIGELIDSLQALKKMGRRMSVREEKLTALARAQPALRPSLEKTKKIKQEAVKPMPKKQEQPSAIHETLPSTDQTLDQVLQELGDCRRCKLAGGRQRLVFGMGNPHAELMFIGEGPGRDEDIQGLPFVGRAGQLLDKMIAAMGKSRDDVYIANIVKCRPPNNREPEGDEVQTCLPFLKRQIQVIRPRAICCLGRVAFQNLLQTSAPISGLRGIWQDYAGIPVMPTYHPAYLLRNPAGKKPAWEDLQKVMERLDWPLPKKKGS